MQIDPRTRVSAPAVGLIVTGALGALSALLYLAIIGSVGLAALMGEEVADALPGVSVLVVLFVVALAVSAFIVYAGLRMRQLQGWTLSLAGAIVAMVPCLSPCCILGLPIGIWAVLVLIDEEVKRAFDGGLPGSGLPGPPPGYGPPPA